MSLPTGARAARAAALWLSVALAVGACAGSDGRPAGQGGGAPVRTPVASLSASLAATVALLRDAAAGAGYRLDPPPAAYRPSEPTSLADVPRTVQRASTADVSQGFVVVYELPDAATAASGAADLAAHVGSGFGMTNFPAGARFHVAHLDDTVIFTWWSAESSVDAGSAERAFEALRTVGTEVPVPR